MSKRNVIAAGLFAAMVLASVAAADATQRIRHVEFSIAGSAQAFVDKGGTSLLKNIPLRIGAFVTRDVEIEAEGIVTVGEGCYSTVVEYIASLKGSYNFPVGDRLLPFVLFGYGFTDSAPIGNVVAGNDFDDVNLSVLNAGLGWKFLFMHKAALRVEYRLQKFHGQETYDDWYYGRTYTHDIDFTLHSVFCGVSLFF